MSISVKGAEVMDVQEVLTHGCWAQAAGHRLLGTVGEQGGAVSGFLIATPEELPIKQVPRDLNVSGDV